jgi:hypothetical protein
MKAEGRRQEAEGRRQKAEGRRQKAGGGFLEEARKAKAKTFPLKRGGLYQVGFGHFPFQSQWE